MFENLRLARSEELPVPTSVMQRESPQFATKADMFSDESTFKRMQFAVVPPRLRRAPQRHSSICFRRESVEAGGGSGGGGEEAEEVEEARERAGGGRCLAKCSSQSLKAEIRELLINFRRDSCVGFVVVGLSGEEVMRAEVT